jgi:hypothetical protein
VALLGETRTRRGASGPGTTPGPGPGPEPLLCDRSPLLRIVNRSNTIIRCQQVCGTGARPHVLMPPCPGSHFRAPLVVTEVSLW